MQDTTFKAMVVSEADDKTYHRRIAARTIKELPAGLFDSSQKENVTQLIIQFIYDVDQIIA